MIFIMLISVLALFLTDIFIVHYIILYTNYQEFWHWHWHKYKYNINIFHFYFWVRLDRLCFSKWEDTLCLLSCSELSAEVLVNSHGHEILVAAGGIDNFISHYAHTGPYSTYCRNRLTVFHCNKEKSHILTWGHTNRIGHIAINKLS